MDKLKLKYKVLSSAIESLNKAINFIEKIQKLESQGQIQNFEYETLYLAARDSLIQRFEFTIDLFWKYLRVYLEKVKKVTPKTNTPADTIREGCSARIITEEDSIKFINMLKSRNLTSHIYKEEIADQISKDIIGYYETIKINLDKIKQ